MHRRILDSEYVAIVVESVEIEITNIVSVLWYRLID